MKYQKELLISLLAVVALAAVYAFETHRSNAKLEEFAETVGAKVTELVKGIDGEFDEINARLDAIEKKQGSGAQP